MGSEMCIRDRQSGDPIGVEPAVGSMERGEDIVVKKVLAKDIGSCLLYTSDAADERSSVDLGGRRIIKKKKH